MIALTRFEDVASAIEWSCSDAVSIAIITFANDGLDVSALESYLPEDRDDYFLSMTNRVHAARKLTPEMAVDLLTDVNAHKESAAFQEILSLNNAAKALVRSMQKTDTASAKLTAEAAGLRKKYSGNG
jgi:hypothetical protein